MDSIAYICMYVYVCTCRYACAYMHSNTYKEHSQTSSKSLNDMKCSLSETHSLPKMWLWVRVSYNQATVSDPQGNTAQGTSRVSQ